MKRYISYLLSATLLAGVFVNCSNQNAKADFCLSNPIIDEYGMAKWDCVYFGSYPQSDATGQTSEPIKWRVLSVCDGNALLFADCNLDVQRYNDSFASATWENATIRIWLNDYFYNKAFNDDEQQCVVESDIINDIENSYGISGGNNTTDKVFLLSEAELTNSDYGFSTVDVEDSGRIRKNTAYVATGGYLAGQGANPYGEGQADGWWMRSVGEQSYKAEFVNSKGTILTIGDTVNLKNCMICPAIQIDLDSNQWKYAGTVDSKGNVVVEDGEASTEETNTSEVSTEELSSDVTTEEVASNVTTENNGSENVTTKADNDEKVSTTRGETQVDMETIPKQNSNNTNLENENNKKIKLGRIKIIKASKKKKAKIVKLKIKKIKEADRYEIYFSEKKNFKKVLVKKISKKTTLSIKNKKLANTKRLYVRARAILVKGKNKYIGKWSKVKKVNIN